ncbi:FAD/NAD(P)-binding protein [Pedobacter sp. SYP-B3415]|uniref:FAD/NAD(P)-binding protein n=1 Tax=Pedobacter sp. SYP-B3415 TaxID=2496641 RepID=UPI001F0E883F|nr:FAD/NAD(P)-binding protein [Pedobacter sp. SYP-B3415]
MKHNLRIGILGGGPAALLLLKKLLESGREDLTIDIFEKKDLLGAGMPYSRDGAGDEHITNVSGNEIPELVTSVDEWLRMLSADTLSRFSINPETFSDYKVLPRRLFGQYLCDQFSLLRDDAKTRGLLNNVFLNATVSDVEDLSESETVKVVLEDGRTFEYDHVVICTGHNWTKSHEGEIKGYFDSPYPPDKLNFRTPYPVALRGASLTAIDAVRTLARQNGKFEKDANDQLHYVTDSESAGFRIVMHSRNGLLPAVRFHLEDTRLGKDAILTKEQVAANKAENGGFLSLDFVFEKNFKDAFRDKDPDFYEFIKDMRMERFVSAMMRNRENKDPFELFEGEYKEAEESIKHKESVYWKEMLGGLSFAMNYPAKYFSAEDMQRLQKVLMPLISIVIAFVPQSSVEEMLALYNAGLLELIEVGDESRIEPDATGGVNYFLDKNAAPVHYHTFIDCIGQPHIPIEKFPFRSMVDKRTVTQARVQFKDPGAGRRELDSGNKHVSADQHGNYFLNVPGVAIDDSFAVVDFYGARNERIYLMAVPYIGGYNPDYSGLDFCEAAGIAIAQSLTGVTLI